MSLPDELGGDLLDLDLAQLSMDFHEDLSSDPLFETMLPDVPEVPRTLFQGPNVLSSDGTPCSAFEQTELSTRGTRNSRSKLIRTREKNRLAQARYRERQKQELTQTRAKLGAVQKCIIEAKARLNDSQHANERLVRRAAEAASSLLAVTAPSDKTNQVTSQHTTTSSTHAGRLHSEAIPSPAWASAASKPTQRQAKLSPPTTTALPTSPIAPAFANTSTSSAHTTDTNIQSVSGSDCSNTEVTHTPARMTTAFTSTCTPPTTVNQPLDVAMPRQPRLPPTAHCAPLYPHSVYAAPFPSLASFTQSARAMPRWPWPVSDPSALNRIDLPRAAAHSAGNTASEAELQLVEAVIAEAAERVRTQRQAVAAEAQVREEDVHWCVQMPYLVTPCDGAAAPAGTAAADAHPAWTSTPAAAAPAPVALSCSTAVASLPCMASLFAFFMCSRFEGACLTAALCPDDIGEQRPRASTAATTYATLAKLEGILCDSCDPAAAQTLQAACGVGSRAPMAPGVASVIQGIAARYHAVLPAAGWAFACASFVDFMISKHKAKGSTQPCPLAGVFEEEIAPGRPEEEGGSEPGKEHVASRCPKCAVVMVVTRALRDALRSEALHARDGACTAAVAEGGSTQELWARAAEVSACFALLTSQCLLDAPYLMRHMRLLSTSPPGQLQTQADMMSLELYKSLQLSPAQHSIAAAAWRLWLQRRRELSQRFHEAMAGLARLISIADMPMHELQALYTAQHAAQHTAQQAPACQEPLRVAAGPCAAHAADDAGAVQSAGAAACTCTCSCCAQHTPWQLRLLGANSADAAASAMQRLRDVHAKDCAMLADMTRALCLPDAFFSNQQMVSQQLVALKFGLPMVDWLQICRTAAREQQHSNLLHSFA